MTPPIRPAVHALVDFSGEPETMTMRQAVEWWKSCVRAAEPLGQLTAMEERYMNTRWGVLIQAIATREQLPAGMLSYFLGELAQTEIKLKEVAEAELGAAMEYGS